MDLYSNIMAASDCCKRMLRALRGVAVEAGVALLIVFVLLEVVLRLFPGLIPLNLLVEFPDGIRARIAARRGLPTYQNAVHLERSDGGAPILLQAPHATITYDFDDPGVTRTVTMDDQGFCNPPEQTYQLPSIDIITLGDSMTWCFAVRPDETWMSRLGALTGHSEYSVGLFAMGPYEYLQLFKRFGITKSPRVVVMNLYEGNDFYDALSFYAYREQVRRSADTASYLVRCVLPEPLCSVYRFVKEGPLGERSYAFNLLGNGARLGLDWVRARSRVAAGGESSAMFHYSLGTGGASVRFDDPSRSLRYILDHREDIKAGTFPFDQLTKALQTFVALSRQYGFTPIVSYTPAAYTVYAGRLTFDDAAAADTLDAFSRAQRMFLAAQAGAVGYTFVDLTPALRARASETSELLYFPSNLHLTPTGHRVVAEELNKQPALRTALGARGGK